MDGLQCDGIIWGGVFGPGLHFIVRYDELEGWMDGWVMMMMMVEMR